MILYHKLCDIDRNSHKALSKSFTPAFQFKRNQREEYVKNEIKSLAQANLFILKKLLNKSSEYSVSKYEKEYQQSQKYKKIICRYPSINFTTPKNNNEPLVESYKFNTDHNKFKLGKYHKLPKIVGLSIKTNYKIFNTSTTQGSGPLDHRYYKEATKSSRLSSTRRSTNFRGTKETKKSQKLASNIDEESNEVSSSGKRESGDEKSVSRNGSGYESGRSGNGSCSGNGSGSGGD